MQQGVSTQKKGFLKKIITALDSINVGGAKEREYLIENMSMLVAGGLTIFFAIDAVQQEVRSGRMRRILERLKDDIANGFPVWKAFKHSRMFGESTISLVRIGEESGKLTDNLKLIAAQGAKERDFHSKIRSAMLYPVFVLSLTVIVGVLIAWFILPRLATVFAQLDVALPTITVWLIATGQFLNQYGYVAIPAFILVLVLIVFFTFFFSKTKYIGQTILFAFPGIQRLIREIELARFGYLLGTLLQAGLPVVQALDSLEKATLFPHYKKLYAYMRESVADGNSFQKTFSSYKKSKKLIPIPIQQLVVAGERSGSLSNTLLSISANFEAKTEQTTKNISVILEPVLLVIVWIGVVAVALAVILPIYSLIGGLNTDPTQQQNTSTQEQGQTVSEPEVVSVSVVEESIVENQNTTSLRILETEIEYLNLRAEALSDSEIIGRVFPGEVFEYTQQSGDWYKIIFEEGVVGWVFGSYVEIVTPQTE